MARVGNDDRPDMWPLGARGEKEGGEKEVGKVWKILEDKSELGIGEEKRGERRKGDGEEGR